MVDWNAARRIAGMLSGEAPDRRLDADLPALAVRSERLVGAYTGLKATRQLPAAEGLGRHEWIDANLVSMRAMLEPATARLGSGLGPLSPILRTGAGLVIATEVGVLMGFMAQRVLGQYDLVLLDPDVPSRLLFVEPNLVAGISALGVDGGDFVAWVAIHEVTHALQFDGVPWLRPHLAGLLEELIAGMDVALDPSRLLRLPKPDDLKAVVASVRDGGIRSFALGSGQSGTLDSVQATMAVIEGYAEHVMDVVGKDELATLPALRAAMDRRRASQSAPARLLGRLLGIELKLRQYEVGKRFCDAVVAEEGIGALNRVWSGPGSLPSLAELDRPGQWLKRTRPPTVGR